MATTIAVANDNLNVINGFMSFWGFTGFYGTRLGDLYESLFDSEIDYYKSELGVDIDTDKDVVNNGFEDFKRNVCENYISHYGDIIDDFARLEYVGINSPLFYNYRNDAIVYKIIITDEQIEKLIIYAKENKELFAEEIKSNWSDSVGFHSFLSNNIDEWFADIEERKGKYDDYIEMLLWYVALDREFEFDTDKAMEELEYMATDDYALTLKFTDEKEKEIDEKQKEIELERRYISSTDAQIDKI